MKNKSVTPKVKIKRLTEKEITNLPEEEFEKLTRAKWNKWNASVKDSDDIIPYNEFYSEEAASYKRKPIIGYW
jgi:hypothetical protein